MAKISINGVGTAHDGNVFEFTPKCKRVRSCKSFRRRGLGIMTVRECWVTTDHGMELSVTPMITGKGQQHFLNLFCGEN